MIKADHSRPKRAHHENGFSLIEVLVALTLLAVVLGTGYRVMGDGLNGIAATDRRERALVVAEGLLANLRHSKSGLNGIVRGSSHGFDWAVEEKRSQTVQKLTLPEAEAQVVFIAITVQDRAGVAVTLRSAIIDCQKRTPG